MNIKITEYQAGPAKLLPYDPIYQKAAEHLICFLTMHLPGSKMDHIGSTSIPGCDGKGIIDILITFNGSEELETVKQKLYELGFQRQSTRDPFPEDRPMRLGAFEYSHLKLRTHIHVVSASSHEVEELLFFKKLLTENEEIRRGYIHYKREIIEKGIIDPVDYSVEKGNFIAEYLKTVKNKTKR